MLCKKNRRKSQLGAFFSGQLFFRNPVLAGDRLFKSMWGPKTIPTTSQVCSRVAYSFLHMCNSLEWCFAVVLPCQLTDFCDHIFFSHRNSLTSRQTISDCKECISFQFFRHGRAEHMFTQYFGRPRYYFAMFWVCYPALTRWAWFWSPFTHTRLTMRVCDIDWVFCVFFYSLVPSL